MNTYFKFIAALIVFLMMVILQAHAQRGVGNTNGIAREGINPEIETIQGTLDHLKTGPCENTTGHAYLGTHIFLKIDESETLINIHLGPADFVDSFVDNLEQGQRIEAQIFQTGELNPSEYIAKQITSNGKTLQLREDNLRPIWAGSRKIGSRWQEF